MNKTHVLLVFLFISTTTLFVCAKVKEVDISQNITTITYIADISGVFSNPERGWHNRRDVDGRGENDVRDFSDIQKAGHSLVHSYLRLDDFRNIDLIPESYLNDLQEALHAIRTHGVKIILRPTYVWSEVPSVSEDRILKHIDQLNAVISKNADVISHLEVGYLGKWGEWHSGMYTDLSSREDGDTRYRILKRILETTPETLPIAVRYPMHIHEFLDVIHPPKGSKSLTQQERDRVGHHGDCFLFNDNDRGTYARLKLWFGDQTVKQQKEYTFNLITSFGGNKIMGGETCSPAIDRIEETQVEMAKANWTEINISFWTDAIDQWRDRVLPAYENDPEESEFQRISRKLGYRLRLIDASFALSSKAGSNFTISANLYNDGYAGIIKKRPIYLVFVNNTDRYDIELADVDVRTWLSGTNVLNPKAVKLPSNMNQGVYKVALWLPDLHENLRSRAEYSVRFANKEMWDSTNGYNILTENFTIK